MVEQYPNGIVRLPHPKTFERLVANFKDFGSFKKFGQLSLRVGYTGEKNGWQTIT